MTQFKRLIFSGLGASVITIGLGLGMVKLIEVDFEAKPKPEPITFVLAPVIEEPQIIRPQRHLDPLEVIVPPPAPPETGWDETAEPKTPEPETPDGPVDLVMPEPGDELGDTVFDSAEAIPILRFKPVMPGDAQRSGHCRMEFAVGPDGSPFDIKTLFCTERLFERESVKATAKFKYRPKRVSGQNVAMHGVKTTIRYKLKDDRGRFIPEA